MNKNLITGLHSLLISVVGVFVIDYFFHLFLSDPMETQGYFIVKMIVYFLFSVVFLLLFNVQKNEFVKVCVAAVVLSSLWGMYYNVFPILLNYYPAGIVLNGLTFLGMGLWGTGIAFGMVHILAFVGGYYSGKALLKKYGRINS